MHPAENCLLTNTRGGARNESAILPAPGVCGRRAVEAESESSLPPETSFGSQETSLTRFVRCMKGVCCHEMWALLIVPSLFTAPSYPAVGGEPAIYDAEHRLTGISGAATASLRRRRQPGQQRAERRDDHLRRQTDWSLPQRPAGLCHLVIPHATEIVHRYPQTSFADDLAPITGL